MDSVLTAPVIMVARFHAGWQVRWLRAFGRSATSTELRTSKCAQTSSDELRINLRSDNPISQS